MVCDKGIIGNKIKEARKTAKLSQAELAEKVGISEKHISNIERGLNLPDLDNFFNILRVLKLSINEFGFEIDESENPKRKELLKEVYMFNDVELNTYTAILSMLKNLQNKK